MGWMFPLGYLGVDRFMRGQIGFGILKILEPTGLWALIDWIIALTKLGSYKEEFVFVDGKWSESDTLEAVAREKREIEEEELRERERIEKYKTDILSGAISYDKEVQQIADELSKYKSYFKDKASEIVSMVKEYTSQTSTGSWDTRWYSSITDKIKGTSLEAPPYNIETKLSDLREIKQDARLEALADEINMLKKEYRDCDNSLSNFQSRLRM
jgi:predicted  nucleic acid-binding Zn-ribbon protein